MIAGSSAVLIGGGLVAFLLFFVSFQIREQRRKSESAGDNIPETNQYLELWLLILGFFVILLVAKATLDLGTICEVVPINQTITGNLTSIDYSTYCYNNSNNTNEQFYTTVMWGLGAAIMYFLFIIFKMFLTWAKEKLVGGGRG